jgi:threonine dehydrogenase-like Zn-dependent dehydrogenase
MRAITVTPGVANSAKLDTVDDPPLTDGAVLVRTLALGVCGTDREIVSGAYGWAPQGQQRLILGHESLGRVESAPQGSGLLPGDLVVGIVRRPDPVPCPSCAAGEWDMCRNGQYTERGIKERNGYGADYFRIEPDFAVKIDPALGIHGVLLEPTSIVAKAWDHIEKVGQRSNAWRPETLLVTGAGPVGLLAALMGSQRGLEVHVLDRSEGGPKPSLVRDLGGTFHAGGLDSIDELHCDILMECTGSSAVVSAALGATAAAGITCLLGVTAPGQDIKLDIGAINRTIVLGNEVVFGSVNANRKHYQMAAEALSRADSGWLDRLITRRVDIDDWPSALQRQPDDIKVIINFAH